VRACVRACVRRALRACDANPGIQDLFMYIYI